MRGSADMGKFFSFVERHQTTMKLLPMLLSAAAITAHAGPMDTRTPEVFEAWFAVYGMSVVEFRNFLVQDDLQDVVPMHQLLRTATDWKKCKAQPFTVPPKRQWTAVRGTLSLIRELRGRGLLQEAEVVSGYRDPNLNKCAGGSKRSAHREAFALDMLIASPDSTGQSLCKFWLSEGKNWKMGLSKYPSGRFHIDAYGYRTWGKDGTRRTTFCK